MTKLARAEQIRSDRRGNGRRPPETLRLAYLIGTYPGLTTTFIDREIRALRAWGVSLQIVAIHRPDNPATLSPDQSALQTGAIYLLPAAPITLLLAHLYFFLTRPLVYLRTLAFLATRPHPSPGSQMRTVQHFGMGVYAAYLLRDHSLTELHAHFIDRTATLALVAARLLGIPYSLSIHAGADVFVERVLADEKIGEARHAVTCTLHNRTYLEHVLGRDLQDKISHIRHGLNLSLYRPQAHRPANGKPLIVSVGQLAERKGFAQLIEVCSLLRARGYEFRCEIVGEGPQRARLERMIDALALHDTVTLCGALRHGEVIKKYDDATLFALLCIVTAEGDMDGIPNVIAEAMAMRAPVVSTTVSAIPELVVDGVNGLLAPPGDATAAAAAIARLLDEPDLRQQLADNAQRTIEETFDVDYNVRRFAATLWPEWFTNLTIDG